MKIRTVVVTGGGPAGLLVALTLKRRLPQLEVRVLRNRETEAKQTGEGSTPAFPRMLFEYLQLKADQFYREVQPTWKIGTRFLWGPRASFFHAFAREYEQPPGELSRSIGFYYQNGDLIVGPASALMAQHKAFPRRTDGSPLLSRQYGFHLETSNLAAYLDKRCRESNVTFLDAATREAQRDDNGIGELHLASGESVRADLFIDASGSRSELLNGVLGEPFVSYQDSLLCDRIITGKWSRTDEVIEPYTTVETLEAGWSWQIENEHSIDRGYVYASRFISDKEAMEEFRHKNPKLTGELRIARFRSGRYARSWVGNVVAVDYAAGFIEPLQATDLTIVCAQATRLADSLSDCLCEPTPSLVELYNDAHGRQWDEIRDFLAVHYAFNTRIDTPFWRTCRERTGLGNATRIVRFYQENGPSLLAGPALLHPDNPFGLDGYLAVLIGQNVPYDKLYRPSAAEHHVWKKRITHLESHAQRAMTVKDSLDALRRVNWSGV